MRILVTGGAGYIGSICVERLVGRGHDVVVLDNLQEGHAEAIMPEAAQYIGDYGDRTLLDKVFREHRIEVVIHFAAETTVEFSMTDPARYFKNNTMNGMTLLEAMRQAGCRKMIFSSTAATFGEPQYTPMDEEHPQRPINAYGESKLMYEAALRWYGRAYGFQYNVFRYFNAAGASGRLGEAHRHESHLIPVILSVVLGQRDKISIFGSDYPTPDGTCIRDYVHVCDIADAHILALDNLAVRPSACYNLGSGCGYSNLEIVRVVEEVVGRSIPLVLSDRRSGDPARLVATSDLARAELGWRPRYESPRDIVQTAWEWHRAHPQGYGAA
jgi:UDP-glucose 4-epimerase